MKNDSLETLVTLFKFSPEILRCSESNSKNTP